MSFPLLYLAIALACGIALGKALPISLGAAAGAAAATTAAAWILYRMKRTAAALGLILGLATVTHLPFLTHSFGLMDSDEAIPALMSKHIAEGRQPPLFFYGAFFQGSFPQHFTAAFFKLFGYSVPLAKGTAFLAFALFLVVQFFLIKKPFSFGLACAAGLFSSRSASSTSPAGAFAWSTCAAHWENSSRCWRDA